MIYYRFGGIESKTLGGTTSGGWVGVRWTTSKRYWVVSS